MKRFVYVCFWGIAMLAGFNSCRDSDVEFQNNGDSEEVKAKGVGITQFPTATEIRDNPIVARAMESVWSQTKRAANVLSRYEMGFFIYYNRTTKKYSVGTTIKGRKVEGCSGTKGQIEPGIPPNQQDVCAFFHTHTPLTWCSEVQRNAGPSAADLSYAHGQGIPCLIYDYSSSLVVGMHPIDAPAHVYICGPARRVGF